MHVSFKEHTTKRKIRYGAVSTSFPPPRKLSWNVVISEFLFAETGDISVRKRERGGRGKRERERDRESLVNIGLRYEIMLEFPLLEMKAS